MELGQLNLEAAQQEMRSRLLLALVILLTALHVLAIGSLLRRWLLWPMEQLGRQVEALARDEPPAEPLLTRPLEMANLAEALDRARRSLRAYQEQLLEAERLTTIGQLAAQLAHNRVGADLLPCARVQSCACRSSAVVGAESRACEDLMCLAQSAQAPPAHRIGSTP